MLNTRVKYFLDCIYLFLLLIFITPRSQFVRKVLNDSEDSSKSLGYGVKLDVGSVITSDASIIKTDQYNVRVRGRLFLEKLDKLSTENQIIALKKLRRHRFIKIFIDKYIEDSPLYTWVDIEYMLLSMQRDVKSMRNSTYMSAVLSTRLYKTCFERLMGILANAIKNYSTKMTETKFALAEFYRLFNSNLIVMKGLTVVLNNNDKTETESSINMLEEYLETFYDLDKAFYELGSKIKI